MQRRRRALVAVLPLLALGALGALAAAEVTPEFPGDPAWCAKRPEHQKCSTTTTATTTPPITTAPPPGPVPGEIPPPPTDITRMPGAPGSTGLPVSNVTVTSPRTITGTVTDTNFVVPSSATFMQNALVMTEGSRLERVTVTTNGRVELSAIAGMNVGALKDVSINALGAYTGASSIKRFEGVVYATRGYHSILLSGTDVTLAPDALIRTFDGDKTGSTAVHLARADLAGTIFVDASGNTSRDPSATGFRVWEDTQNATFNYIVAKRMPGYSAAVVRASSAPVSDVTVNVLDADAAGGFDGDPGLVITGGTIRTTIGQAIVRNHTLCVTIGEYDFASQVQQEQNVSIGALLAENCRYGGLRSEYGDGLDIGALKLVNTGTVQTSVMEASLQIGRSNPHGFGPSAFTNVNIRGLDQSGTTLIPDYAVYVAAGSSGSITGRASSWRVAKVRNDSTVSVSVTG